MSSREHGPHAVLHGPDGWLYLVVGNHAWAQPPKLADNSPLTRWPTGGMGPDQGKPGSTEDVLLPRLNDARGHAANVLAPGGTIWRLDTEGKNMSLVAAGFRNHHDAAFNPDPNDRVQRIVVSPDGSRVYVGGNFTRIGCSPSPGTHAGASAAKSCGRPAWRGASYAIASSIHSIVVGVPHCRASPSTRHAATHSSSGRCDERLVRYFSS